MIVIEIHGEHLIIPEDKDIPYFEDIKNKILKDNNQTFKYLREAYIKYRNVKNLPLNKKEKKFISDTIKKSLPLVKKITNICAVATIRGAVISDVIINETVSFKEYSNRNNGVSFYHSNC